MESNTRRVRTIFSVVANPVRLDIIQKLNMRGNMTYTELKSLTGFKAKKESGKFAYHLRKLVKANLVTHYSSDKKYGVTPLGKAVLLLARQIGEQALAGGPRLVVYTSDGKMEEFATDKIIQSLVKEAGVPLDLAYNLAGEIESTLLKFKVAYVTTSLIRELINAKLFEMNLEEYRQKLSRVGISVHDLREMLERRTTKAVGTCAVSRLVGRKIMAEYILHYRLPRHIAESYMSGDVGISNLDSWMTAADTIFIQASSDAAQANLLNILPSPMVEGFSASNDLVEKLFTATVYGLNEAAHEVVVSLPDLESGFSSQALLEFMKRIHVYIEASASPAHLTIGAPASSRELLSAYLDYCKAVSMPLVALSLYAEDEDGSNEELLRKISEIVKHGGLVNVAPLGAPTSYLGLRSNLGDSTGIWASIHGFSVNLVRLAFESEGDPSYFRSKLLMALRLLSEASQQRFDDLSRPMAAQERSLIQKLALKGYVETTINLIGVQEALRFFKDKGYALNLLQEVLRIGRKATEAQDSKMRYGLLFDKAARRFFLLDYYKYGEKLREELGQLRLQDEYTSGLLVETVPSDELRRKVKELKQVSDLMAGNISVGLTVKDKEESIDLNELVNIWLKEIKIGKPVLTYTACDVCGSKSLGKNEKCLANKHTSVTIYSTVRS